jgi:hypothetical protein
MESKGFRRVRNETPNYIDLPADVATSRAECRRLATPVAAGRKEAGDDGAHIVRRVNPLQSLAQ